VRLRLEVQPPDCARPCVVCRPDLRNGKLRIAGLIEVLREVAAMIRMSGAS
jgi:hypothetical protein